MKVLKDWGNPIEFEKFVKQFSLKQINEYNIFYVIKPNSDLDIFKYGVSSGAKRLIGYFYHYGNKDPNNECKGFKIWYCAGTKRQKTSDANYISRYNIWSYQKERQVYRDLTYYHYLPERGKEWVKISSIELKDFVVDTIQNRNNIRKKDEYRIRKSDRIIHIINHRKKRNNHLEYLVQWNRGVVRNNKVNDNTWESLQTIKKYPKYTTGLKKLSQYRKTHNITGKS